MQDTFMKIYPNEEFREIEWNGVKLYAGSMGSIKDKDGIYKPQNKSFKYNRISVGGKNAMVHQIIATAFVPNPDNLETVNHVNGNRWDNRAKTSNGVREKKILGSTTERILFSLSGSLTQRGTWWPFSNPEKMQVRKQE